MKKVINISFIILFLSGCHTKSNKNIDSSFISSQPISINNPLNPPGDLIIHTINVGQADAIFVQLPNSKTLLIDGGNASSSADNSCGKQTINCTNDATTVKNYIKNLGYTSVNFYLGSHPHEDHMGVAQYLLNPNESGISFETAYIPWFSATTAFFKRFLVTIENNNIPLVPVTAGLKLIEEDNLKLEFLSPNCETAAGTYNSSNGDLSPSCSLKELSNDNNSHSAVLQITYGEKKMLFMGDSTGYTETNLINRYGDSLKSDILKIGHHGAQTHNTNSISFLNKVKPTYALISSGYGNTYGHPTTTAINNLIDSSGGGTNINNILRTDYGSSSNNPIKSIICESNLVEVSCNYWGDN